MSTSSPPPLPTPKKHGKLTLYIILLIDCKISENELLKVLREVYESDQPKEGTEDKKTQLEEKQTEKMAVNNIFFDNTPNF